MQLSVTGHHIDITDSLRNYVGTKLAKLERHFDHMTDIHCVLTIDILVDKLDRQVKKHKEKLTDHHAREVARYR
jgi:putative sigma-54 modulation protein